MRWKKASSARCTLPCCVSTFKNREHNIGVSVSETNHETITPQVTTTAKDLKNWPITPPMKMTGPKMQTRERVAANTAKVTSRLPLIAADIGSGSKCSRCLKIFSSTTIASSTTTPTNSSSARSVTELKV